MRPLFIIPLFLMSLVSSHSWAVVFDCTLNFKFNEFQHTQKLIVQYEENPKYLHMPVYEVLEDNAFKFHSMGIEIMGTGLAKIDGIETQLFIQSYWSDGDSLRAFVADPWDHTAIIAFDIKYGDKQVQKLPINLYYSRPVADSFRTGACERL